MDDINYLLKKYHNKGILVDTNILLLFFVGLINPSRISLFKRTQQFTPEDYNLLVNLLNFFNKIITTPNILTEVNSLANQLGEPERSQCFDLFAQGIPRFEERYIESRNITSSTTFIKFGLTDCGISEIARNQYLVLTDDFKLANYLQTIDIDTINFNNLRFLG